MFRRDYFRASYLFIMKIILIKCNDKKEKNKKSLVNAKRPLSTALRMANVPNGVETLPKISTG